MYENEIIVCSTRGGIWQDTCEYIASELRLNISEISEKWQRVFFSNIFSMKLLPYFFVKASKLLTIVVMAQERLYGYNFIHMKVRPITLLTLQIVLLCVHVIFFIVYDKYNEEL